MMIYIVLNNPPHTTGGIEKVVREIICGVSDNVRKEIILICSDPTQKTHFFLDGVLVINLRVRRNRFFDFVFLYSRLIFSYRLFHFLMENIADGDVVNVHEGGGISFFVSMWRKKIARKFVLITTVHGLTTVHYAKLVKYLPWKYVCVKVALAIQLPYFWCIDWAYLHGSDYIVTVTHSTQRTISKCFRWKFSGSVIVNGMGQRDVNHRSTNDNKKKKKTAIIVGSVNYLKGLDIAIAAVMDHNYHAQERVQLDIVGFSDFDTYYDRKLLPKDICYIGHVDHAVMEKRYRKADFLIFPSRTEEFPLTVLETLQYGLPFIVSKECHVHEIDDWSRFGMRVSTFRIRDWSDAIAKLCDNDTYDAKVRNIAEADMQKYDWRMIARQYEKLFIKR